MAYEVHWLLCRAGEGELNRRRGFGERS